MPCSTVAWSLVKPSGPENKVDTTPVSHPSSPASPPASHPLVPTEAPDEIHAGGNIQRTSATSSKKGFDSPPSSMTKMALCLNCLLPFMAYFKQQYNLVNEAGAVDLFSHPFKQYPQERIVFPTIIDASPSLMIQTYRSGVPYSDFGALYPNHRLLARIKPIAAVLEMALTIGRVNKPRQGVFERLLYIFR